MGWKVIVATMISRNSEDAFKNSLNALIYANWPTYFDGIADFAGNANLGADGAYTNGTYFNLASPPHITTLSDTTIVAPIASSAVNTLYP